MFFTTTTHMSLRMRTNLKIIKLNNALRFFFRREYNKFNDCARIRWEEMIIYNNFIIRVFIIPLFDSILTSSVGENCELAFFSS